MAGARHRRPRAVVFDMDGLLLDTEPIAARAWSDAAARAGVTFDPALALRMVGSNFADCSAMLRAHAPASYPVNAVLGAWHAAYDTLCARDGVPVKRGVVALIDWLTGAGIKRAVATSTRRARAAAKLADARLLHRFDAVVGGDEVARGKPAPDIYVEAARRIGVPAGECVALEDSEPGVRSALGAGMTVFMVPDLVLPSDEIARLVPFIVDSLDHAHAHIAGWPE
jgi:HAD superfamily hydrolase (TIGR01509 family)